MRWICPLQVLVFICKFPVIYQTWDKCIVRSCQKCELDDPGKKCLVISLIWNLQLVNPSCQYVLHDIFHFDFGSLKKISLTVEFHSLKCLSYGWFFSVGFGAFFSPWQDKYFYFLASFQKQVCIIHPDVLITKGKDLMVKEQEKWDWEERVWERGGLHGAVRTTNKYFSGLLCGSSYTRSSCLTVSPLDAGF